MEDRQKVYIKGNSERGNKVIKILEDLGGKNLHSYLGTDTTVYYFIDPKGVIDTTSNTFGNVIFPYIKEFYNEIKLSRWKPKYKEHYYHMNWTGEVVEDICYGLQDDEACYKFGNCFKTQEEAEAARDKIEEILKNNDN